MTYNVGLIPFWYTNSFSIYLFYQLINTIVTEYGTEDLDLLQQKLQKMRILDNVELPTSVLELLLKHKMAPL